MVQPDERTAAPPQQPPAQQQPPQQPPQPPAEQPAAPQQQPAGQDPQPDGAFAVFRASDGTADAWLRTDEGNDPVGYVRENAENPPRTVRYTNPAHWAEDVDGRGMAQVDGGDNAAPDTGQEQNVSEVTGALQALADGKRNLDDVVKFFREREWPRRPAPAPGTAPGSPADSGGDSPGSFAEVADAYSSGLINHQQYVALAQAATEAMREQSGMGDSSGQQQQQPK